NRTLEDRRQVLIELTAQGEALIKTIFPRQAEAIRQEMSVLSLEEQQALGRLLRKLGQGRNKET
ncbi:MAG: hypothetical protein ROW52_02905, partial [Anaerolineaceae bacterium]